MSNMAFVFFTHIVLLMATQGGLYSIISSTWLGYAGLKARHWADQNHHHVMPGARPMASRTLTVPVRRLVSIPIGHWAPTLRATWSTNQLLETDLVPVLSWFVWTCLNWKYRGYLAFSNKYAFKALSTCSFQYDVFTCSYYIVSSCCLWFLIVMPPWALKLVDGFLGMIPMDLSR